jgi:hypothetical protein
MGQKAATAFYQQLRQQAAGSVHHKKPLLVTAGRAAAVETSAQTEQATRADFHQLRVLMVLLVLVVLPLVRAAAERQP